MHLAKDLHRIDDDAVFIPNDEHENVVTECFYLALTSSVDGPSIDYQIVKDVADKHDYCPVQLHREMKLMMGAFIG